MKRAQLERATRIATLLLTLVGPLGAATGHARSLRDLLTSAAQTYGVPAIAAAVITGDRILELDAIGVQRLDLTTPVLASDRFHVGSMTKAMTATLLAVLIEEGRLQWETRVVDIFPEIAFAVHRDYAQITVEDLLSHRAGLPPFQSLEEFDALPDWPGTPTERRFAFTRHLLSRSSEKDRGEFLYSNAGYGIAGAVAERVTGESWKTLMQTRLFEPLEMEASFGWPALEDPSQPWGHWLVNGVLTPHDPNDPYQLPDLIHPAGDVHLALAEYVRFLQLHIRGLQGRESFLSPVSFRKLHEPIGSHALGWERSEANGSPVSVHFGSAGTFYSVAAIAPELDLGVVVVTNAGHERAREALVEVANDRIFTWARILVEDR